MYASKRIMSGIGARVLAILLVLFAALPTTADRQLGRDGGAPLFERLAIQVVASDLRQVPQDRQARPERDLPAPVADIGSGARPALPPQRLLGLVQAGLSPIPRLQSAHLGWQARAPPLTL
ncbi:hypothetical protein FNJ84_12890 [Paracoccus sp. M683]|uniref:hypothetical protein n=1 Tax=Paracoccus sp. M683 TaxID=2594268 RepID=UPI00118046ED|nr:hypothetical protein [Paracoccus sp. M683]TRW96188.1 hypothetical protein FNJ84_12890 [Paracoccus sp. M683]